MKIRERKNNMERNNKLTNGQSYSITIAAIIGIAVLSLPRYLAELYGPDGWVMILIAGFISAILVRFITKLSRLYPDKTPIDFGRVILPKFMSDIVSLIFMIYLVITLGVSVRIFGEVIKMFLMYKTPLEVVIATMLLTCSFLVRKGIQAIGRVIQMIIPLVLIPILILIVPILFELDLENIKPLFRTDIKDIIKGIPFILAWFLGFEVILFNMAYIDDKEHSYKYNVMSIVTITFIYLVTFLVSITRFGVSETGHLIWPTLSLMQTINVPGIFLENVEGVAMGLWILMVFAAMVPLYFIATLILRKVLRCKEHTQFVLPLVPIIYIIALFPDNLAEVYDLARISAMYIGLPFAVFVPLMYYVIALFRKRRGKGARDNV